MANAVQFVKQRIIEMESIHSFTVLGDPGCDGLGTEIMAAFTQALDQASGDFIVVIGDIVPYGAENFYQNAIELMENQCRKPIYMLCGNHDTVFYDQYFGFREYAIVDPKTLIIMMDDSNRHFSQDSLELLDLATARYPRENIILMMHIPPPNQKNPNSISAKEWQKVQDILTANKVRDSMRYIVAGHLHSYYEDDIQGVRLICSGGGGARIEPLPGIDAPYHHRVEFAYNGQGVLEFQKQDLRYCKPDYQDEGIMERLEAAFRSECMAHIRYRLYAEDAEKRGLDHLAKLFRAAADAEFYHARNHQYTLAGIKEPAEALMESIHYEAREISELYLESREYARERKLGLPFYSINDAYEAEKIHHSLFQEALTHISAGEDIAEANYYTCTSCGYTFSGEEHPVACPICGAPYDKIKSVH
ncbi:MAG TPA: hypothetical protein DIT32_02375 [Peptococcaceae bacterium]|nr:hypothetical protein [Peptococcaceae bacterium]